jgi:hypothetical protein
MTFRRFIGCHDFSHPHQVVFTHKPVDLDADGNVEGYLTLWRCPVLRELGAEWEGVREHDPRTSTPGGPLDELPARRG